MTGKKKNAFFGHSCHPLINFVCFFICLFERERERGGGGGGG